MRVEYVFSNLTIFKYPVALVMKQRDVKGLTVGQYVPLFFSNFAPDINDGTCAFCGSHNFVSITKVILLIFINIPFTVLRVTACSSTLHLVPLCSKIRQQYIKSLRASGVARLLDAWGK